MAGSSINFNFGKIGIAGMLTIVFVVLKLTGNIGWSWVSVFSPAWIVIGLSLMILGIVFVIGLISMITEERNRMRRW